MLLDFPRYISICLPYAGKLSAAKLAKQKQKKWLKSTLKSYVSLFFYALVQLAEKYKTKSILTASDSALLM